MSTNIGRARGREVASSKNRRRCWVENSLGTTMRNSRVLSGSTTLEYGENGLASASVKLQELFGLAENARGPTAPGADSLSSARAQREDRRADDARSAELLGDDISRRAKELRAAIPSTPGRTTRARRRRPIGQRRNAETAECPTTKTGWLGASVQLRIRALAHLRPLAR